MVSTRSRRIACAASVALNCISAGSIFTFPLFAPPLARALGLTGAQTNALASSAILTEYASATVWGALADKRGPGAASLAAGILFAAGWGMLGWRYNASVEMTRNNIPLPDGQWIFLCFYYALVGCATAASYFGAIISSTKSAPARHSGLSIGVPCAIFGLSPLFLSTLAPHFTADDSPTASGINDELDPGRWFFFLAVFLGVINVAGWFGLSEIPWDEGDGVDERAGRDSGFVGTPVESTVEGEHPTDRTALLGSSKAVTSPPAEQTVGALLKTPTFWLFGLVIFLSTGPCEMVMSSLGGIVESLLGVRTQVFTTDAVSSSLLIAAGLAHDTRALALRRLHVQVISVVNTVSRLGVGLVSDWLSYSSEPLPPSSSSVGGSGLLKRIQQRFHRPPQVSRMVFVLGACTILALSFGFVAFGLEQQEQLWILSISVGLGYGVVFTLAPAIVRSVYPLSEFGRNWGLLTWFSAAGALLFTPLFGVLLDLAAQKQQSPVCYGRDCFQVIFILSSASAVVAVGLTVLLWKGYWRRV